MKRIRIHFFHPDENRPGPATQSAPVKREQRSGDWPEAHKQLLRDNYQLMSCQELAVLVGRSYIATKVMAQRTLKLRKTHEALSALSSRPNAGQFSKGQQPGNTITGDKPEIRIRHQKNKKSYKWIWLGPKQWQMYHVYQWEQQYGPVPDGKIIVFRDGDTMNCEPTNLEAITRAQHRYRNSGVARLTDKTVASTMAYRNPELKAELLNHPELLDLKRAQIQLNRTIKTATTHDNPESTEAR